MRAFQESFFQESFPGELSKRSSRKASQESIQGEHSLRVFQESIPGDLSESPPKYSERNTCLGSHAGVILVSVAHDGLSQRGFDGRVVKSCLSIVGVAIRR